LEASVAYSISLLDYALRPTGVKMELVLCLYSYEGTLITLPLKGLVSYFLGFSSTLGRGGGGTLSLASLGS